MRSFISSSLAWLQAQAQVPIGSSTFHVTSDRCSVDVLAKLNIFGAEVIDLSAHEVKNYSSTNSWTSNVLEADDLSFCNITVTYTHPGQNDTIHTTVWLPLENWNGRFMAVGGGGWITGHPDLSSQIKEGYAAASTDGGHGLERSAASWALTWNVQQHLGL